MVVQIKKKEPLGAGSASPVVPGSKIIGASGGVSSGGAKADISMQVKTKGVLTTEDATQEDSGIKSDNPPWNGTQWCEPGYEASFTKNLGNMQFAKISVSLKVPCHHAEINKIYDVIKDWVDTRLGQAIDGLENDAK